MADPTIRNFRITAERSSSVRRVPVECYTRIVGYFRLKSESNRGKQAEINDRRLFDANEYCKREFTEAP